MTKGTNVDAVKALVKQYNNTYKEWNQPEKRLAEIQKFTETILSKPHIKTKHRGREGQVKTEEQQIALQIRLYVDEMLKAIENQDAKASSMAGINLAYALTDYSIKIIAKKPKKKAAQVRHKKTNENKEIWLADALAQLKTTVEEKAGSRPAWMHPDYLRHLQKNKKFKDAPKTWKEALRIKFIDQLFEMSRKDLVRGIPQP